MSDQAVKKKCPACGEECPPEAKFCRKCGVPLNDTEPAQEHDTEPALEQHERPEEVGNSNSLSGKKSGLSSGITIPLPAAIAVGAVILVLAALILRFTVFQKADDGGSRQDDGVLETTARKEPEEEETTQSPEYISEKSGNNEQADLSEADIDAVHSNVNEISGRITNEGPVLVIDLSELKNIYIYDPDSMKEVLIRDVSRIYVDEGTSINLDTYFGSEVTAVGTLTMAGQDISISVAEITDSDIETGYNESFDISETTVENYGANLDPSQYGYYDSGIGGFYFAYPAALYNAVTVDETTWQSETGENMQTISFSSSAGSELTFSLSRRTDSLSTEKMTEQIALEARGKVTEFEEILNTTKDGYGKLVFTGWTDGSYEKTVYCLIKIEGSNIMSMTMVTPNYKGNQDELYKGYVTECLYRMCGFSDTTESWRSFDEYAEDVNG